jgi:hypothetical protein
VVGFPPEVSYQPQVGFPPEVSYQPVVGFPPEVSYQPVVGFPPEVSYQPVVGSYSVDCARTQRTRSYVYGSVTLVWRAVMQ